MIDEKKKMTAQGSSVGADDGQSISQNYKTTIPDPDEKSNSPERDLEELYQKMRRMSDPAYLHTVTLDELMDNVFEGKFAVIENLLYTGAYILAGAPKIGKSFLVAQIAHHVSTGQDLWGYKVHQGTVLYLALPADQAGHDAGVAHRTDSAGIKEIENGRNRTRTSKNLRDITTESNPGMAHLLKFLRATYPHGNFCFHRVWAA